MRRSVNTAVRPGKKFRLHTAEHLLLSCPRWAAERQHYFNDSIDIKDVVFWDYVNLVEFLILRGICLPI